MKTINLLCEGNKVLAKHQAHGGVNPNPHPPCVRPWYVVTILDSQMVRDQKKFGNHWNERAENEIPVFSLSDAKICNAIRSYKKRNTSKKKRKDLAVLAKTPRLNRFF